MIARLADGANVTGLDIDPAADQADALGLAAFEAIAMTVKALLDKARFATRKDLVHVDDKIEATLPPMGEYAGVDVAEIVGRADALVKEFDVAERRVAGQRRRRRAARGARRLHRPAAAGGLAGAGVRDRRSRRRPVAA